MLGWPADLPQRLVPPSAASRWILLQGLAEDHLPVAALFETAPALERLAHLREALPVGLPRGARVQDREPRAPREGQLERVSEGEVALGREVGRDQGTGAKKAAREAIAKIEAGPDGEAEDQ